jgi:cytochrome oxidase Cu insertion factor (SCO1/SenC/PrrC family)
LLEIETSSLNLHLHGKWSLVYLSSDQCLSICQQRLIMLQNLRVSTGSNAERIRVILAMKNPENKVNSNELVNGLDWKNIQLLSRYDIKPENDNDIQARKYLSDLDTGVYLIDPLGNLMMKYTLNIESAGIMQDLKRLLRYSRIG